MRKLPLDDLLVEEAWGMETQDLALHLVVVVALHTALHSAVTLLLDLEVLLALPKITLMMMIPLHHQARTLLAAVILGILALGRNLGRNLSHSRMIPLEMHLRMTLSGITVITRRIIDLNMEDKRRTRCCEAQIWSVIFLIKETDVICMDAELCIISV